MAERPKIGVDSGSISVRLRSSTRGTEMVITWSTTKIETGFQFRVYSFGYQVPSETLKIGVCNTRAKAVLQAKKWSRYLKSQQKQAA